MTQQDHDSCPLKQVWEVWATPYQSGPYWSENLLKICFSLESAEEERERWKVRNEAENLGLVNIRVEEQHRDTLHFILRDKLVESREAKN